MGEGCEVHGHPRRQQNPKSVPFWFLQGEGQRVDEWRGMGVNPVFTQYVPGQWDWMLQLLDEPAWPADFQ
jgi:hypothetical protein